MARQKGNTLVTFSGTSTFRSIALHHVLGYMDTIDAATEERDMDENGCEPDHTALELHERTSELLEAAGKLGDGFLQYLYALALRHLEERPGCRGQSGRGQVSADP